MSAELPPTSAASQAALLRRAWSDVAATAAPQLAGLPGLLEQRLTDLEAAGALDEATLLAVAEEASQYALEQGAGEVARTLSKRLRRAIYEFLLALDAVNPAELANAPALTPPTLVVPIPASEPRTPVSFTPADVPGADEPPPAPVPLWEKVAPPPTVREVFRVATRDVHTVEPAAAAEVAEAAVDEMGTGTEAVGQEFADAESVADQAEAEIAAAEAHAVEVDDEFETPAAETLDAEPADDGAFGEIPAEFAAGDVTEAAEELSPAGVVDAATFDEAGVAELYEDLAASDIPADGVAQLADETPVGESVDAAVPADLPSDPVAELPDDVPATDLLSEPVAETFDDAPAAGLPSEAIAAWPGEAPAADLPTEPVVEWPSETAGAELATEPASQLPDASPATPAEPTPAPTAGNGVKPPRELLRVPRQFRRFPPLSGRHSNGAHAAPPDAEPLSLPPAAFAAPVEEAAEPATLAGDDDAFGVPSVPWMLAQPAAPDPEPEPPAAEAPQDEPEDEMGVPFNPFAMSPAPAAPEVEPAAELPPATPDPDLAAFAPVSDANLPRPPALVEEPLYPPPAADLFITPLPRSTEPEPELWTPGPVPTPSYAQPRTPAADPFPIAPREGFHLTDPGALEMPAADAGDPFAATAELPAEAVTPPSAPPAGETHDPAHDTDDGVWRIRQSPRAQLLAERMAQKRREEAARVAFEAASNFDDDRGRNRRRRGVDDAVPDLAAARRQLDEHLRKKRGAEAGALLQRLAQQLGGREIADLALDSGDRCRALGQSRSATNCYLAAWRADPLYETPLWRLSDICLNDQEIELAVGYLERIAELMRSRGDDEGAIGVYRKIAMIAPERQDVRDVIRLAKTTGRLEG